MQPNQSGDSPNDLKVNLGPVIGKVTSNTARILVEFNKIEEVTCTLQSDQGEAITRKLTSKASTPIVFSFDNLRPKTNYKVSLNCALPDGITSSFWTIREDNDNPGNLKAAIVSCNDISRQAGKPKNKDLWAHLGNLAKDHALDYVFHIGDQVYMDMALNNKTEYLYGECRKILQETPKEKWESKKPELLTILRGQYYKTWNHPSVASVLANVPNLMIGDDHEFRDDWGYRPEDSQPGTLDHFYGELARQLYYEYQRQLREDIPWDDLSSLKCEYHHHILNGVGVSFMEYRGCRSWFREEKLEQTHIGASQREWMRDLYKEGGEFDQLNSAVFISPIPLYVLSKGISKMAYFKVDDVQEYWTYQGIPPLVEILDLLRTWKERREGRELLAVGGDFHLGGFSDIMYKKKKIFTQFVSSAINSNEIGWFQRSVLSLVMKIGKLNSDYKFNHQKWKTKNNYGVIEVTTNASGNGAQISKIEPRLETLKKQKK